MNWITPFFTAILSGLAGWLIADLRSLSKKYIESQKTNATEADAIKDGVRCLLHSKLFDFYAEYKDATSLPTETWKEIDRVYEAYHDHWNTEISRFIYSKECWYNRKFGD